jgi:cell shape-determining protein MreC
LVQQKLLEEQNKQWKKYFRKQKTKQKLLISAVITLSVLAIKYQSK